MKKHIIEQIDHILSLNEKSADYKKELEKLKIRVELLEAEFIPISKNNKSQNTIDYLNIASRIAEIIFRIFK